MDFFFGFLIAYITVWAREKYFPNSIPALVLINKAQRERQRQIAERAVEYIRMGFAPNNAGGIARAEFERMAKADMLLLQEQGLTNGRIDDMNHGWNLIP
jgi:hypothetical protein